VTSFERSARLYDAVYRARGKDYAREAARLRALFPTPASGRPLRVLDVGCGTGEHLVHLRDATRVAGLDLDATMLAEARRKLPDTPLFRADMRRFASRRPFDAVTCLFAAIGYLCGEGDVRRALGCMAAALRDGGALLVELPLAPEQLAPARPSALRARCGDAEIARAADAARERDRLLIRFEYSVRSGDREERFTEEHSMLSLPAELYLRIARSLGLRARIDASWPSGGGLLVASRPAQGTRARTRSVRRRGGAVAQSGDGKLDPGAGLRSRRSAPGASASTPTIRSAARPSP
jgi:SAM-dependent methyltransferase